MGSAPAIVAPWRVARAHRTALGGLVGHCLLALPAVAEAQLSPDLRPDVMPWAWFDAGNRLSAGGGVEFDLHATHVLALEAGYLSEEFGDAGEIFSTLAISYEPEERWFVELEVEGAWDFDESEAIGVALARFVWLPELGPRELAVWFEAGYSSEPGVPAALGLDVPAIPRAEGRLFALHLFTLAGTRTDGLAFTTDEVGGLLGARLFWCAQSFEVALSAFVERTWLREENYAPSTAGVALLSLRWYG